MVFYSLTQAYKGRYAHPLPHPSPDDPVAFVGAAIDPDWTPAYRPEKSHRLGDFLDSGAWSDRLVAVMRDCGVTGFATYPIEVIHGEKRVEGYQGVRITGRGGPFDRQRSNARFFASGRLKHYDAVYMDESQWDGTDVFLIPGLGIGVYVSERAAEVLRNARLKSIQLRPNHECRM